MANEPIITGREHIVGAPVVKSISGIVMFACTCKEQCLIIGGPKAQTICPGCRSVWELQTFAFDAQGQGGVNLRVVGKVKA